MLATLRPFDKLRTGQAQGERTYPNSIATRPRAFAIRYCMEPYRLRRWRVFPGHLFTCGRPGRSKWKDAALVPEHIIHEWVRNLPGEAPVIVSLLGRKPDGTSEFSFYPFHGGFDSPETYRGRPSFQGWLEIHHPDRHIAVREHPTEDFRAIPEEVLAAVATDISQFLKAGDAIILIDSGGQSRTGAVCKYMSVVEKFS